MDNQVSELLGKHPHKPMNALWAALSDKSTCLEFIMAIVLRCGIECKATRMEDPMTGPSGLGISPAATPLILACLADRTDIVAALLKAGATANPIENTLRFKALHFAVANDNCEIIDLLIKMHRSGGDSLGSNGVPSPLFVAVERRCINAARALLTFNRRGVHATHPAWSQRSPLHDATKNNDMEMAELLLEFGANPDTTDSQEETPLDWAIKGGFVDMCRLLISHGATMSPSWGSSYGSGTTPLHIAASKGTPTILQLLLDAGIDVQRTNKYHGQTALQCALTTTVFGVLAAETSDFNSTDTNGRTLMHTAAKNGNRTLVSFLIKKGVSASTKDNDGRTPLHVAASYDRIIDQLLFDGCLTATDAAGHTPLHMSIIDGMSGKASAWLISEGSDVNALCTAGTALHLAAMYQRLLTTRDLLDHGAYIDAYNNGKTAYRSQSFAVRNILLSEGATVAKQ